ncbi:MAG: PEP-CTERM sorting domain-containing protein [Phycisphaerae bacterium]|nr:PEP-CTERM sorting domain-containing protein [Phycisphaerae bacterium]
MKIWILTICWLAVISATGFAQSGYAVLVEESPVGSGEITPGIGVHTFNANQTVTLTTVPKAGYHFVYWLGDVSDPTANRTTVSVDGPKIIIAVFERDQYELPGGDMGIGSGQEKLTRRIEGVSSGGSSGASGRYDPPEPPPPQPEPVPEPQTMILLSTGAYMGLRKRLFRKCD